MSEKKVNNIVLGFVAGLSTGIIIGITYWKIMRDDYDFDDRMKKIKRYMDADNLEFTNDKNDVLTLVDLDLNINGWLRANPLLLTDADLVCRNDVRDYIITSPDKELKNRMYGKKIYGVKLKYPHYNT